MGEGAIASIFHRKNVDRHTQKILIEVFCISEGAIASIFHRKNVDQHTQKIVIIAIAPLIIRMGIGKKIRIGNCGMQSCR